MMLSVIIPLLPAVVIAEESSVPGRVLHLQIDAAIGPATADYEMDPDVVNDPLYSGIIRDALQTHPTISLVIDPVEARSAQSAVRLAVSSEWSCAYVQTSVTVPEPVGSAGPALKYWYRAASIGRRMLMSLPSFRGCSGDRCSSRPDMFHDMC